MQFCKFTWNFFFIELISNKHEVTLLQNLMSPKSVRFLMP